MRNDYEVTDVTKETYTIYDKKTGQDIKVRCVFGTYEKSGTLRVRLYCETPGKSPGTFSTLYKELTVEDQESTCLNTNTQFLSDKNSRNFSSWLYANKIAIHTVIADVSSEFTFIDAYVFNIPLDIYRRVCLDRMAKSRREPNLQLQYPMRFRSQNNPGYPIKEMRTFLRKMLNNVLKARCPQTLLKNHKTLWLSGYTHPLLACCDHGVFKMQDVPTLTFNRVYITLENKEPLCLNEIMIRCYGYEKAVAEEKYRDLLEMAIRELIQEIDDNGIDRTAISDFIENQNELVRDITFNKKRLKTMSVFRFKYRENGQPRSARMIVLEEGNGMYTPVVPVAWKNPEWKGEIKDTWRALADPDRVFHIEKGKGSGCLQVTEHENRKK